MLKAYLITSFFETPHTLPPPYVRNLSYVLCQPLIILRELMLGCPLTFCRVSMTFLFKKAHGFIHFKGLESAQIKTVTRQAKYFQIFITTNLLYPCYVRGKSVVEPEKIDAPVLILREERCSATVLFCQEGICFISHR